ncbi:hypothetical protein KUTeg_021021 [Tegillarca granosa]|uniref:Choline/carnitine acyltransferase domain-containing protein n=1 Tax=Tegillarca granosa TaxID=220873 RepID=A0ABQ9E9L3_TEGGR|nr:hypothetical protein KUTeg_021021 [Tegillarca granosa]
MFRIPLYRVKPRILKKFTERPAWCSCTSLSYSTDHDRDYLHRSILPTDYFQPSLPRLPIPKLRDTVDRYLTAQRPILSFDDYFRTENIIDDFYYGPGKDLNKELVELDKKNKHTSYISGPWFDMYLKSRVPVVLNHNPFMVFTDDPKPQYQNQLIRATNMVISSLRFMKTFRANILEPEVFHLNPKKSDTDAVKKRIKMLPRMFGFYASAYFQAYPLDMSQYRNLFNSTRIPRHGKDELFTDESAKHLLVMRNGHFYMFDALDKDGYILPANVIMSHLQHILKDNRAPPEFPVACLTADNRDTWATARQQLLNAGNEMELKMIDSALFVLVLDDVDPKDPNEVTRTFLHGDGVNRWFDKSFMLMVNPSGLASVNFEHSWGDGVAVLRYFNEVFKDSTKNPQLHPGVPPANLDPIMKETITESKKRFDKLVGALNVDHLDYKRYTKKFIKKAKLSPDSVMQLAIQKLDDVSVGELRHALSDCSQQHSLLTKQAAMGQGFDRHLFGLRTLAEQKGESYDIFTDPCYKYFNHFILSTSTITSPAVLIGGFGPVVDDGYGVGYAIEDNRIGYNVTSYLPSGELRDFMYGLKLSLDDLYDIMEGRKPKAS